jgi:hypothetical protein
MLKSRYQHNYQSLSNRALLQRREWISYKERKTVRQTMLLPLVSLMLKRGVLKKKNSRIVNFQPSRGRDLLNLSSTISAFLIKKQINSLRQKSFYLKKTDFLHIKQTAGSQPRIRERLWRKTNKTGQGQSTSRFNSKTTSLLQKDSLKTSQNIIDPCWNYFARLLKEMQIAILMTNWRSDFKRIWLTRGSPTLKSKLKKYFRRFRMIALASLRLTLRTLKSEVL